MTLKTHGRNLSAMASVVAIVSFLTGCASTPAPKPTFTRMSCKVPTFSAFPESEARQDKGGVVITLAPVSFECVTEYRASRERATPTGAEFAASLLAPDSILIEETKTPYLRVTPDRLTFTVTISNQLPRVFRGMGALPQFAVGGKSITVQQSLYAELTNLIIPPRGETQITVTGPLLSELPDQATLGVYIYDIATQADAAGTVTERQNFEWFYNYTLDIHEKEGEVVKTRGWVKTAG